MTVNALIIAVPVCIRARYRLISGRRDIERSTKLRSMSRNRYDS